MYRVSVSCSCIHFYMLYRTDICIYTCFRIKQINPFFTKSKMFPYGVTNRQLRYEMLFVTMNPWSCGKDCVECYKSGCKQVLWSNHGVKPNPRRRYGAPISRKRLYLVMIENSVMRGGGQATGFHWLHQEEVRWNEDPYQNMLVSYLNFRTTTETHAFKDGLLSVCFTFPLATTRHPPNWESEEWASLAVGPPSCFSRYGEMTSTAHGGSIPVSWIGHPHIYHCINERNSHSRFSQRHILNPRKVPKGAKWVKRHRGWAKKKQVRMYTGAQVFWFMCKNKFNS